MSFMKTDKDFLKRRLEDSVFYLWLLKKHSEKAPQEALSAVLTEEYKNKYTSLMEEYICLYGDEPCEIGEYAWSDK